MREPKKPEYMTRRNFLKVAGAAAGTFVLPHPVSALTARPALSIPPLRAGLLLPDSKSFPLLSSNLKEGVIAGLQADAGRVTLVTEAIGTGGLETVAKALKLVREDHVDVILAFVNARVAEVVNQALLAEQTPLIVANAGENMVRHNNYRPATFYNTLHLWQAHWAMGSWAAKHYGKKALVASSVYESGYDSLYAFRLGLQAEGGAVAETDLWQEGSAGGTVDAVISRIRALKPDFVYALYNGARAIDFVKAYAASGLAGSIPLAGSAFLVEDGLLAAQGRAAVGIKSGFSWTPGLENAANAEFAASWRKKMSRQPDAFALLGYDTSLMIRKALTVAGGQVFDRRGFVEALRAVTYDGLRGESVMDSRSLAVRAPLFLRTVKPDGPDLVNAVDMTMPNLPECDSRLRKTRDALLSGWHNAYLCV